jgi:peptidoglycan/LPS O-acetylase OafA/YrhL
VCARLGGDVSYYSVWPIILILIALLAVVATPLFKAADSPPIPARSRIGSLDGLRGFLALAVFFQHGALYHTYIRDGLWVLPTNRLYGLLGSFGVSMFFMITGFLFWSQILAKKGRPDWVRLYIGRIFRIGPIYLVAVAIMMACVFAVTGPHLRVGLAALAREILGWGALGLESGLPLNGVAHPGAFLAYVTWSLRWEWFFYGSLLITAVFARHRISAWALPLVGLIGALAVLSRAHFGPDGAPPSAYIALFCVGMLTAASRKAVSGVPFERAAFSIAAAIPMLAVLTLCPTAYGVTPICLLGSAFFLIANGATLFGLLGLRPARRLGDVSFGIYLLQGLVFAAVFATPAARAAALASPVAHWVLVTVSAFILVSVATAAHVFIERPGVDLGRKLSAFGRREKPIASPTSLS